LVGPVSFLVKRGKKGIKKSDEKRGYSGLHGRNQTKQIWGVRKSAAGKEGEAFRIQTPASFRRRTATRKQDAGGREGRRLTS